MCSLNTEDGEMVLTCLPENEDDCVTASPNWLNKSLRISGFKPSATTVNVAEFEVHPQNWSLYLTFNPNRFIRECPELRICVIVNPECVWAVSHYLRRQRPIENATWAPRVYKQSSRDIADFDRHVQKFYFRNIVLDESNHIVLPAALVGFVEFRRLKEVHRIFGVRFFVHRIYSYFRGVLGLRNLLFSANFSKVIHKPTIITHFELGDALIAIIWEPVSAAIRTI